MATSRTRKRPAARRFYHSVAKPSGLLHPRVQHAGPEHFGIVCFDCAKLRSKFFLADFYGTVLTKQYRQPVDPGNKTDDTDLMALYRATVTGCALLEATRDAAWTTLQLLVRQRRLGDTLSGAPGASQGIRC